MRRPIKGYALLGSVPSDREPPAAVWRSGRPNLREVRRQARATPETSAPDIAEDVGIQPIEKPMVASNSPMAMNETATPWRARGDRSCS
jgi:hypothetical protein